MSKLFTIGYEKMPADAVLGALQASGTEVLVDVRAVAASRRPGFAKSQLSAGVSALGIGYVHLRSLGTPPEGRLAARRGRYDDLDRIFREHLATPAAQEGIDELLDLARTGRRLCLLCFERHPEQCHRRLVAEAVTERLGVSVEHLIVSAGE